MYIFRACLFIEYPIQESVPIKALLLLLLLKSLELRRLWQYLSCDLQYLRATCVQIRAISTPDV